VLYLTTNIFSYHQGVNQVFINIFYSQKKWKAYYPALCQQKK
jgi:hypothetical protein